MFLISRNLRSSDFRRIFRDPQLIRGYKSLFHGFLWEIWLLRIFSGSFYLWKTVSYAHYHGLEKLSVMHIIMDYVNFLGWVCSGSGGLLRFAGGSWKIKISVNTWDVFLVWIRILNKFFGSGSWSAHGFGLGRCLGREREIDERKILHISCFSGEVCKRYPFFNQCNGSGSGSGAGHMLNPCSVGPVSSHKNIVKHE